MMFKSETKFRSVISEKNRGNWSATKILKIVLLKPDSPGDGGGRLGAELSIFEII